MLSNYYDTPYNVVTDDPKKIIKAAIFELGADENQEMPVYMGKDIEGKFECEHAENVYRFVEKYKDHPNVHLVLLPKNGAGMRYVLEHEFDIVSMSAADWDVLGGDAMRQKYIELYENKMKETMFLIGPAGNEGEGNMTAVSQRGWFTVGAVDEKGKPRGFSSWDENGVHCVAVDGQDGKYGTSFAVPQILEGSIEFGLYHIKYFGFKPNNPDMYWEDALNCCVDVWEKGWDKRTGEGLYMKPNKRVFKVLEVPIGTNEFVKKRITVYRDGKEVITSRKVRGRLKTFIKEGWTVMSASDIALAVGASKDYQNQTAIYTSV